MAECARQDDCSVAPCAGKLDGLLAEKRLDDWSGSYGSGLLSGWIDQGAVQIVKLAGPVRAVMRSTYSISKIDDTHVYLE